MSIRKLAAVAATATLGVLVLGLASASATSLRTGGALLSGNQTLRNNGSDQATLQLAGGNIRCSQSFFDMDVNATTAPSLTGSLTSLTFTSCTDALLAVTVLDCTLHAPPLPTVHIVADPAGGFINGRFSFSHMTVRCALSGGTACYYTFSLTGNYFNSNSSIDYAANVTAVMATLDAAPKSNCGISGTLAWRATDVVTAAGATVTVTTS